MPKQYSLDSMMNDVLQEVEALSSTEKTASLKEAQVSPEMRSEYAQYIMKVAAELRAIKNEDVSYEDMQVFLEKQADWGGTIKGVGKNLIGSVLRKGQEARAAVAQKSHNMQRRVAAWGRQYAPPAAKAHTEATMAARESKGGWKPWQKNTAIGLGIGGLATAGFMGGRALAGKGDKK